MKNFQSWKELLTKNINVLLKRNDKSFLHNPNLLHFSFKEMIGELGFQKEGFQA